MPISIAGPSRTNLEARVGCKIRVTAVFVTLSKRKADLDHRETVLLRDIRDAETGFELTDHLWFNRGRLWKALALAPGDIVCFVARPIEYRTGYWGTNKLRQLDAPARRDYRLTPPEEMQVIRRARREQGADKAA